MRDVVVIGEANPDLIMSGGSVVPQFGQVESLVDSAPMILGGSGAITAAGLARLGVDVALMAVVGDDPLGQLTLGQLVRLGVDVTLVGRSTSASTGISVHLVAGDDRAILTHTGAIDELAASNIKPSQLATARHIHSSSIFLLNRLRPDLAKLLAGARSGGASTSIDTNWDPAEKWEVSDVLSASDIALPNVAELRALARVDDDDEALERLGETVGTVAVKKGALGGVVLNNEGLVSVAAPEVEYIVDSIGAGDSFDAGFIYGHLDHRPLVECLALGVACGALSLREAGGTAGQATAAEAELLAESLL